MLQRRIYFLTFIESLEIILSQYKETFEVLLYYPTTELENIKVVIWAVSEPQTRYRMTDRHQENTQLGLGLGLGLGFN